MVGVLERLAETRGLPEVITVDNGPEFAGKVMDEWAYRMGVKLNFIRPGRPVENTFAESFNGHEREARQGGNRELEAGLQRGQASQLTARQNTQGVC